MRKLLIIFILLLSPSLANAQKERVVFLYTEFASCTGVIIQTNLVLTNAHCLQSIPKSTRIVKKDDLLDLMLLNMPTPIFERIKLTEPQITDEVYTYGHPMGQRSIYYSKGYVMSVQDTLTMTSIITLPGNSGSPLFYQEGLAGLIKGTIGPDQFQPISATVCSKKLKEFLEW